jgi:hypothetical protein
MESIVLYELLTLCGGGWKISYISWSTHAQQSFMRRLIFRLFNDTFKLRRVYEDPCVEDIIINGERVKISKETIYLKLIPQTSPAGKKQTKQWRSKIELDTSWKQVSPSFSVCVYLLVLL